MCLSQPFSAAESPAKNRNVPMLVARKLRTAVAVARAESFSLRPPDPNPWTEPIQYGAENTRNNSLLAGRDLSRSSLNGVVSEAC
jgi:hypothetical protein